MKKKQILFTGSLLTGMATMVLLVITQSTQAVSFQAGDVFAAVGNGKVQHWRTGTGHLDTYSDGQGGYTTGMAFDSTGNLYMTNFTVGNVSKFNNNGNYTGTWATNDSGSSNESILFDKSGNTYIGQAAGTKDIIKRAADGSFLASYDVATESRGSDWIDLAADQSTMYYTSEGRNIYRYDVSTGTQLSNFATLAGNGTAFALRLLSDGGLIVADSNDIKRLDSTGTVTQTYDVTGNNSWFSLNLDGDGTSFWSGNISTGKFFQFDIASGTMLNSFVTGTGTMYGVAVYGEITQGGDNTTDVPEPATLFLFGAGLLGFAFTKRKVKL